MPENTTITTPTSLTAQQILINNILKLSALFHDVGKCNTLFQHKLISDLACEPIRHDLLSFFMFQSFISAIQSKENITEDTSIFEYLSKDSTDLSSLFETFITKNSKTSYYINIENQLNNQGGVLINQLKQLLDSESTAIHKIRDTINTVWCKSETNAISQTIAWLILTHHRLLNATESKKSEGMLKDSTIKMSGLFTKHSSIKGNSHFNNKKVTVKRQNKENSIQSKPKIELWQEKDILDNLHISKKQYESMPYKNSEWIHQVKKCCKLICQSIEQSKLTFHDLTSIAFYYLRPLLVTADAFGSMHKQEITTHYKETLLANRCFSDDEIKGDTLTQHLKTVAEKTDILSTIIQNQEQHFKYVDLTSDVKYESMLNSSQLPAKFEWQNTVEKDIQSLSNKALPFFGVVISETGSGKTIIAPKIIKNLTKKARFTLSLGFTNLVLQTGNAYAKQLCLKDESNLTTIIGHNIKQTLFNYQHEFDTIQTSTSKQKKKETEKLNEFADIWSINQIATDTQCHGSESLSLIDDNIKVHFYHQIDLNKSLNKTYAKWEADLYKNIVSSADNSNYLFFSEKMKDIIDTPIVVCTIDYLIRVVEQLSQKNIHSFLRNLSADLILDEIDNYSANDLISIAKLCYLQGLAGKNLILMSATISQVMFNEFYSAYHNGLTLHNKLHNKENKLNVGMFSNLPDSNYCKEMNMNEQTISSVHSAYQQFVTHFTQQQKKLSLKKHKVNIMQITNNWHNEIVKNAITLHKNNHFSISHNGINKKVSIGFVRFNNTDKAISLCQHIWNKSNIYKENESQFQVFSQCYHAKLPFLVLNYIEQNLNEHLNRKNHSQNTNNSSLSQYIINHILPKVAETTEHIVLLISTTSIQETGRDHDYDWAILEPATARSLVQAVGRVKRHREIEATHPNVYLMSKPIKEIDKEKLCWNNPGLENEGLYLTFEKKNQTLILADLFKLLTQQANTKYVFEQPVNIVDNLSNELSEQYVFSDICLIANHTNCLTNYEYISHFKALSYINKDKGNQSKYNTYKLFEQDSTVKLSNSHVQSTYFRKSSLTNLTISFHNLAYHADTTKLTTLSNYTPTVDEEHYHKKTLIAELKGLRVIENYKSDNMIYPLESNIILKEAQKVLNIINPSDNKEYKSPDMLNSLFTTQIDSSFMSALLNGFKFKFSYMTGFYKEKSI